MVNNINLVEVLELVKLNAMIRESLEDPFFLELGGKFGVSSVSHGWYVECRLEVWMIVETEGQRPRVSMSQIQYMILLT